MTALSELGITLEIGRQVPGEVGMLNTDIVLPSGPGPHPVLLVRTPYGTRNLLREAIGWARLGCAAVVQDVRGRFESEGTWHPWHNEGKDGLATLRWIGDQPWSDARVIAYGSSYAAHCALELAQAHVEPAGVELVGVIAAVPALSLAHTIREPSGVPRLLAHASWWPQHGERRTPGAPVLDLAGALDPQLLRHQPISSLPRRLGVDLRHWQAAWDQPRPPSPTGSPSSPPLLVIAGRHDVYAEAALDLWRQWRGRSAHLVLGPWHHDLDLTRRAEHSRRAQVSSRAGDFVRDWVAATLHESPGTRQAEGGGSPGVPSSRWAAAIDGDNCWRVGTVGPEELWRPDLIRETDSRFTADPDDPHPALLGPVDANEVLDRHDACTWATPRRRRPLTLIGTPTVRLQGLQGDPGGVPLDWCVRLLIQTADGAAYQLGHAAVRTRGSSAVLRLPPLADRVSLGDRLLVQVSGHLFPVHPRDPQNGHDPLTATTTRSCTRTVGQVSLECPQVRSGTTTATDRTVTGDWL